MKLLLGSLVILAAAAPSLFAQRAWQGGSGDWHDPAHWTVGVPVANTQVQFPYPAGGTAITVSINNTAVAQSVQIGEGVDLTLQLGSDVSLTTSSNWRIGYSLAGSGSGAATLTVKGPTSGIGSLNLTAGTANNQFFLNNGSRLVLQGANLKVESAGPAGVGTLEANHNNGIELKDGVTFKTGGFRLGWSTGTTGGSGGNFIKVQGGSTLQITGGAGMIGNNIEHYQNFLSVTGAGSNVEIAGQDLTLGNTAESNHGGNYVHIADGGSLSTSGKIQIYGYNAAASSYGGNRIAIDAGGTLTSSSTIEVGQATSGSESLLQLKEGGKLEGTAEITVYQHGMFEAEGDGLGREVKVSVKSGGTLATGVDGTTEPVELTLKGTVDFEAGGILQMAIRANGADALNLASGATLSGEIRLVLDFDEVAEGTFFTLIKGDTLAGNTGVTATFDLSGIDARLWDLSQFNEAGGWRIQAIPEPSSLAFLAAGTLLAGWGARRRAGRKMLPLLAGLGLLGGGVIEAAEPVTVLDGEMEVERASDIRLTVTLPEVSPDDEAILEFTAWYPAPKHAGFYSAMRVYWSGEELEEILDRPAAFQTVRGLKEGKSTPTRRKKWWMVPVGPSPEAFSPKEPYYIPPEQMNPFLFRFRLPTARGGKYELKIVNNMKDDYDKRDGYQIFPVLKVRDVIVRQEPK